MRERFPLKFATILTTLRIFLGPLFLLVYVKHPQFGLSWTSFPIVLFAILLLSEVSDLLDGYVARKWNQVTDLGKILDPTADSIVRISVFLTFTRAPIDLPLYLVFIFLYRDVVIAMLRTLCALRGVALAARMSGKLKAVIQGTVCMVIVVLLLLHTHGVIPLKQLKNVSFILTGIAALYTLISGVEYIAKSWVFIKKALGPEGPKS